MGREATAREQLQDQWDKLITAVYNDSDELTCFQLYTEVGRVLCEAIVAREKAESVKPITPGARDYTLRQSPRPPGDAQEAPHRSRRRPLS